VYRDRIGAFGCFDDCFNIMGGYFLLGGKRLFSEIFFNHMPIMAHISAWIQGATHPNSLYMLIYQHRMFVIYVSLVADVLLVARFGLWAFLFALLYETTKGFIFGERFLAEALIVYPIVYVFGIAWKAIKERNVHTADLWISTVLTLEVIFTREPYIPLVLTLWGTLLIFAKKRLRMLAALFLVGIGLLWMAWYGVADFIFNIITVNKHVIGIESQITAAGAGGPAAIVLYPVLVLFSGQWNLFHSVEAVISGLFLLRAILLAKRGAWKQSLWLIGILTLANIRTIAPGALYFGTFHHLPWYALLLSMTAHLLTDAWQIKKGRIASLLGFVAFVGVSAYGILSPTSYLHEKVDRQTEFNTNYGNYYVVGEVVGRLSDPSDTLFLDGQDDPIYWQAKRYSTYPYSWYTSFMPYFPVYMQARDAMFSSDPPQFYYRACADLTLEAAAPPRSEQYVRLAQAGKPSCVWVRKDKVPSITADQWKSVVEFSYSLPKEPSQ